MLTHLKQVGLFDSAKAILFGDFIKGEESDGSTKIPEVLKRFSKELSLPVYQCENIGHGFENDPLPLNVSITIPTHERIEI